MRVDSNCQQNSLSVSRAFGVACEKGPSVQYSYGNLVRLVRYFGFDDNARKWQMEA